MISLGIGAALVDVTLPSAKPGCYPHHVTQRGNRRQQTFFCDDDYREYVRLLSASCARAGSEVWA
ncbi:MAG TPA: hypothetical protein DCY47_09595 [Candidatus Accumulibacter sp.]|nr:hypothetical protein [Accumulibacter sp.]